MSAHKVFDAVRFPLATMRHIKGAVPGATVNDVCIAYVGLPSLAVTLAGLIGYYSFVSVTLNVFEVPTPPGAKLLDK